MADSTISGAVKVPLLSTSNYAVWIEAIQDHLQAKGLWYWIHEDAPDIKTEKKEHRQWALARDSACGEIRRHIAPELRATTLADAVKSNPKKILDALKAAYGQSSFATRFNAQQALFLVKQEPNETAEAFIARARDHLRVWQATRPSTASAPYYTVAEFDNELLMGILLMNSSHPSLQTSLLVQPSLDVNRIQDALLNEEARLAGASAAAAAAAAASSSSSASSAVCAFCDKPGHAIASCFRLRDYKAGKPAELSSDAARARPGHRRRRGGRANAVHKAETPTESAGAASLRPSTSPLALTDAWNADTGATSHMTPRREWFKTYAPSSVLIRVANGQVIRAAGVGTVEFLPVKDGLKLRPVLFSNVLHVPDLNQNLLSVLTLSEKHRFRIEIEAGAVAFVRDGAALFYASVGANRVALLSGSTAVQSVSQTAAAAASSESPALLWHRRFAHISGDRLRVLGTKGLVSGLPSLSARSPGLPGSHSSPPCISCIEGKQTRDSFAHTASRRSKPLELVHSDLHGPLPPTSNGYQYWITFTDDATRYRRCWVLRKKSEAFAAFQQYKAWAEKQTSCSLKALRDDKGGEYMSAEWERFMLQHGIERQHTTAATPQQNGVAERTNRILDTGVASLLSDASLASSFWGEALSSFIHVLNRSPSSAVDGKTPYEAFYHRKPDVSHLRVWGCRAYVHVQKAKRRAFQPKSQPHVFIGYPIDYKGWKCWDPANNKVVISRDV